MEPFNPSIHNKEIYENELLLSEAKEEELMAARAYFNSTNDDQCIENHKKYLEASKKTRDLESKNE